MIYWDNAATTWPKPMAVTEAMSRALTRYGANPGRGGHTMGMAASREVYRCRETAAEFFHLDNPGQVVFTLNCTMAMNMALKGILRTSGRVVVSDLEHNAVMRPLHVLSPGRPIYDVAQVTPGDDDQTVEAFRRCITPFTRAIVCTHASNVFGVQLPIRRLGELAREHDLLFVVDAAQTAGVLPLDMEADHIDFLCVAGHKGLYGPMGTGMLLCGDRFQLPSFVEGGTGSQSLLYEQPDELPDRLESGTPNTPGICGLRAGMEWVKARGIDAIRQQELRDVQMLYDAAARGRIRRPRAVAEHRGAREHRRGGGTQPLRCGGAGRPALRAERAQKIWDAAGGDGSAGAVSVYLQGGGGGDLPDFTGLRRFRRPPGRQIGRLYHRLSLKIPKNFAFFGIFSHKSRLEPPCSAAVSPKNARKSSGGQI